MRRLNIIEMLSWAWRLVILALLIFCAWRLETLQDRMLSAPLLASAAAANPLDVSPEQLRREQQERQALLRATQKTIGHSASMAADHNH